MNVEFVVIQEEDDFRWLGQDKEVIEKDIHFGAFEEFLFCMSYSKQSPSYLQDYSILCPLCFKFCDKNKAKCVYLFLNSKWVENYLKLPLDEVTQISTHLCKEWSRDNTTIAARIKLLWEQSDSIHFNVLFFRAFVYDLLYRVIDEIESSINVSKENIYHKKEKKKVEDVVEKAMRNVHLPIPSLESLSQEVGMSVSKFKILFKKIYGQSPYQYMLEQKLAYARKLYLTGEYTLSQIALKIGYSHISGFTKIYKKRFNER